MPSLSSLNLPSIIVESNLSSPCSCSDALLSWQKAALTNLDSIPPYDLVLWTDGSVPFGKGSSRILANCSLCGTEATLSFSAGPVCSSFSAEACAILQALCWSWQHQQLCHLFSFLLLSDSRHPGLSSIFPFISISLADLSSFSSCTIRLQWVPRHSFLPRSNTADELARWEALLMPSTIPCSPSSLISRIQSYLFSDWRRTVSSKFFDTQIPLISTEELVVPRHACYVLSHIRCNGHSLLISSYHSTIGRIKSPSCSTCRHPSQDTSPLILH